MASDEAAAAVREEMEHFANGTGPYKSSDLNECAALFLERNHVVRIPEEGELDIERSGNILYINGVAHIDGSDPDLFDWQAQVERCGERLRQADIEIQDAVTNQEKARAVLAFLTQEQQEASKQLEMAREKRLDELAKEFFGVPFRQVTGIGANRLFNRLVDLEEEVASRS